MFISTTSSLNTLALTARLTNEYDYRDMHMTYMAVSNFSMFIAKNNSYRKSTSM